MGKYQWTTTILRPRPMREKMRWKVTMVLTLGTTCALSHLLYGKRVYSPASTVTSEVVVTETPREISIKTSVPSATKTDDIKYILFLNSFWGFSNFTFGLGREPFQEHCPSSYNNCFATNNASTFASKSSFDAVMIHGLWFELTGERRAAIESWREPHQRFIYFIMESADYDRNNGHIWNYRQFFNWTMTYRLDSDIQKLYGFFALKKQQQRNISSFIANDPPEVHPDGIWPVTYNESIKPNQELRYLAKRPNKAAWIVSNCDTRSRREWFVDELKQYIQVDQFGKCAGTPCNKKYGLQQDDNCTIVVERDYKFYLALENAFTKDYVTEKFFLRARRWSLPIVLGQANYSIQAPPHSYINALDFGSVRELADYLHKVDQDDDLYLSYFWWHDYYEVKTTTSVTEKSFCRLCEMLNQDLPPKVYTDFDDWWRNQSKIGDMKDKLRQMVNDSYWHEM